MTKSLFASFLLALGLVAGASSGALAQDKYRVAVAQVAPAYQLDFVNGIYSIAGTNYTSVALVPGYTFNRGLAAYADDGNHGLQLFATGTPRINSTVGYLSEDAATNSLLRSRTVTNATWTKTNMTAATTATSADGLTNTASTLTATANNATACQALTVTAGAYIVSAYIKRIAGVGVVALSVDGGSTYTDVTSSLSASYYTRVPVNADGTAGLAVTLPTNPTVCIKLGTNTDIVWFDLGQLEANTTGWATSPIPTTSAPVTRPQDILSISNASLDLTKGTFVAEALFGRTIDSNSRGVAGVGSSGRFLYESGTSNGNLNFRSATTAGSAIGVVPVNSTFRAGYSWGTHIEGSLNGAPTTNTVVTESITASTALFIGSYGSGNRWVGQIRNIAIYPYQFTSQALRAATQIPITPAVTQTNMTNAYGQQVVKAGYSGHAIQVERLSDNVVQTFDYVGSTVGSSVDKAAIDTFLAGGPGVTVRLYDQVGSCDAVATTPHQFMYTGDTAQLGTERAVVELPRTSTTDQEQQVFQYFTLDPTCLSVDPQNFSAIWIGGFGHSLRDVPIFQYTGTDALTFGQSLQLNALGAKFFYSAGASSRKITGFHDQIDVQVVGLASSPSLSTVYAGLDTSSTGREIYTTGLQAGGLIGGTTIFQNGVGVNQTGYSLVGNLLVYGRGLGYTEYYGTAAALYANYGVNTAPRRWQVSLDGDSICEGINIPLLESYGRQASRLYTVPATSYNVCKGGGTAQSQTDHILDWVGTLYNPALGRNGNNHVITVGSNDLHGGVTPAKTPAETWAAIQNYVATLKAEGWQGRIFIGTLIQRCNVSQADIDGTNTLIRAGASSIADGYIDFGAEPVMNAPGACNDTALYQDGTHPTRLGDSYLAAVLANYFNALIVASNDTTPHRYAANKNWYARNRRAT